MKRCLDILCVLCLMPAALPILLACIVLIKLDSNGPVLFRQMRMGRGFRLFPMVKLRTMRTGVNGSAITLGADTRITRVGQRMRRHKFDELPQLWNVLCGHMSMVGPRPVIPDLAREFRTDYERLLSVRPGLTDPATLKYRDEAELLAAVSDPLHFFKTVITPDKIQISAAYIERANIWNDLEVLARTARALVPHFVRTPRVSQPIAVGRAHFVDCAQGHPWGETRSPMRF